MEIDHLTEKIRAFRDARDWLQFHSPKEMAVALVAEAAELMQHFVWKNADESWTIADKKRPEVMDEMADVGILLFELADNLKIDLGEAMLAKLARNEARYPAAQCKGTNLRHYELAANAEPHPKAP